MASLRQLFGLLCNLRPCQERITAVAICYIKFLDYLYTKLPIFLIILFLLSVMGRIRDYLDKQIESVQKSERNIRLGKIIFNNLERLNSMSDTELRIYNSNERNSEVCPVDGTRSLDSVYRKISKAARFHDPDYSDPFWDIAGIIHDHVAQLQIKIEERRMSKPEYNYLYRTSMKKLLIEWSKQIRNQLERVA